MGPWPSGKGGEFSRKPADSVESRRAWVRVPPGPFHR